MEYTGKDLKKAINDWFKNYKPRDYFDNLYLTPEVIKILEEELAKLPIKYKDEQGRNKD